MNVARMIGARLAHESKLLLLDSDRLRGFVQNAIHEVEFARWRRAHPCREFGNKERFAMFEHVAQQSGLLDRPIDYLEFGVHKGFSFRWWVEHNQHADSRFVGFDTFTGLPEDWIEGLGEGAFDVQGNTPDIDDARVTWKPGLFQDTLPGYMEQTPPAAAADNERPLVVHLDADLYSSTLFALLALLPVMKSGDLVFFDEFGFSLSYDEFRAWLDAQKAFPTAHEVLARTGPHYRVAIRIK